MGRLLKFGCLGLVAIVVLLVVIAGLSGGRSTTQQVSAPAATSVPQSPGLAAAASKPTEGPKPTAPSKPTDTPQPVASPLGKVGEPFEAGGVSLTVAKVSKTDQTSQFAKAKPGNTFVVTDVIIESPGRDESPYNPLYFKVRDSEGFEASGALMGAPEPALKSGKLAKGEKVRGNVAFEVKADAKGFVLLYEPLVILGGYRVLRIDLGL